MSYIICCNEMSDIICDSYSDVRIQEAFFKGMRLDYTLVYPNKDIKEVKFKTKNMVDIEKIDEKIDKTKKQLLYLSENKNISSKERNNLRQYYEQKLNSYTIRKDAIIKNIPVKAEVLDSKGE